MGVQTEGTDVLSAVLHLPGAVLVSVLRLQQLCQSLCSACGACLIDQHISGLQSSESIKHW